jgi:dUTP pyrophosphatase
MNINFTVIEDEIDFTPTKANSSDMCYDLKAHNFNKYDEKSNSFIALNVNEFTLRAKQSIIIGSGVSLELPYVIELSNKLAIESLNLGLACAIDDDSYSNDESTSIRQRILNEEVYESFIPSSTIQSRSGLGFKHDVEAFNGQIDNTFNDQLMIKLSNMSSKPYIIKKGDRIAQLKIELVPLTSNSVKKVKSIDGLNKKTRGGFGSSGR